MITEKLYIPKNNRFKIFIKQDAKNQKERQENRQEKKRDIGGFDNHAGKNGPEKVFFTQCLREGHKKIKEPGDGDKKQNNRSAIKKCGAQRTKHQKKK